MQAMVLAAGFGTRLRPYTEKRPKPLFPVLGEPLLLRIVGQLRAAGYRRITVNAHYLGERVAAALDGHDDITLQMENKVLGTGGGLRLAAAGLSGAPVLVTNGDIYHTIDYAAVMRLHVESGCAVTMVMHDRRRYNTVRVAAGRVTSLPGMEDRAVAGRLLAFTGIHVVNPGVLMSMPENAFANIIDCYAGHLRAGGDINAVMLERPLWRDIGTPADYLGLHGELLRRLDAVGVPPGHVRPAPRCLAAASCRLGSGVRFKDWCYCGSGAVIGDHAVLSRVVVWDGARVAPGAVLEDCVVTE